MMESEAVLRVFFEGLERMAMGEVDWVVLPPSRDTPSENTLHREEQVTWRLLKYALRSSSGEHWWSAPVSPSWHFTVALTVAGTDSHPSGKFTSGGGHRNLFSTPYDFWATAG